MAEKKKTQWGQVPKFKKEYCEMLVEHMARGFSYKAFAGKIKVCRAALYKWEKRHPEWKAAKAMAEPQGEFFWEKIGLGLAVGAKETKDGNVTAWIFNMKNRFGWRDKTEISGDDQKPLELRIYDYGQKVRADTETEEGKDSV